MCDLAVDRKRLIHQGATEIYGLITALIHYRIVLLLSEKHEVEPYGMHGVEFLVCHVFSGVY